MSVFFSLSLVLVDDGMKLTNTHTSNLDGIRRIDISSSNIAESLFKSIIYFTTELRILI